MSSIKDFENAKQQCLGKRDKSFAGRIDVKAVDICSVINERCEYYTTSSCSGRAFLYQGHGVKALQYYVGGEEQQRASHFQRWRISHDLIQDAVRYFDLSTLEKDPTGGADPIRSIGQFEHAEQLKQQQQEENLTEKSEEEPQPVSQEEEPADSAVWLRMEPFILHVCCRSLTAASALLAAARPTFKNVGLTTWKTNNSTYIVAIWGDEGLDMPLSTPGGQKQFEGHEAWLQQLINERLERNWSKIRRCVQDIRELPEKAVDEEDDLVVDSDATTSTQKFPKSFDVIGDVALFNSLPQDYKEEDLDKLHELGTAILQKNKGIKVCVARTRPLEGVERAAGELLHLAGPIRSPLMTTHTEGGIKCVIDLKKCFFSPRMGPERRRICQQVARGENVLVLFAGVGMEALQIAGRTEASEVVAVEWNQSAVTCAQKGHKLLARNKAVKCLGAADRLEFIGGNVLDVLPTLKRDHFDRIFAPRPKEGTMDGDLGVGDGGEEFLHALLPVLKEKGGECHWYDFCADHEFPACDRTRGLIERVCSSHGLAMQVIHVANAGSVAKRQLRVCMDFRLCGKEIVS
jgi:tRNA G37 N-methylase Trm5